MPSPYFGNAFGTSGNMLDTLDDAITEFSAPNASPLEEMGVTGLKRAAGIVDEEFLPALRGRKAVKVFQEMSLNDPVVGSLLFAITQLLRNVEFRVEAPDNTPEATEAKDFVEQCMEDMSHTWDDMVSDILTCMIYGWSWHEIVYKKRMGPWEKDPKKKSKYTDGRIGWRKIAIRSQETLLRWVFDEDGGIKAMVQLAPPNYQTVAMPIERSLLFRIDNAKGNPEGRSLLRNAYRPWFFKKRLEEFEAIGVERDLAGMPVARVPASYMDAPVGSKERKVFDAFRKMVSGVRRDEHEGLVLPTQYDRNTKQPLFDFELMSSGGSRTFDTNALIQRYEQRILMTVLADFILVGHEGTGSYSLHVDKTGIFRSALNTMAQMIADTFNRHAIPRLFDLNGWHPEELPQIVPANVDPPDIQQLAGFMTSMGGLGMEWFPDADLEEYLREVARLPKMPDEMLEMRREMSQTHQVMTYADQQMMYEGMRQKAELMDGGYSPEQAQMASETPNEEMAQQQADQMAMQDNSMVQTQAHQVQAGVDEERAQNEHARTLEMMQAQEEVKAGDEERDARSKEREDQFASAGKERDDAYADKDAQRQEYLQRMQARFGDKQAQRDSKEKDRDVERQDYLKGREAELKDADAKRQIKVKRAMDRGTPTNAKKPVKGESDPGTKPKPKIKRSKP